MGHLVFLVEKIAIHAIQDHQLVLNAMEIIFLWKGVASTILSDQIFIR